MEQYPASLEFKLITVTLFPLSSRHANGNRSVEQHGADELMSTPCTLQSMHAVVALCQL